MSVLALDTSSRGRAVVLRCSGAGAIEEAPAPPAGTPLGAALPRLLVAALSDDVDAVVVVTGPGSYTGLRAGMAAALGVAHARALPVHGAGTLEVVAAGWDAPPGTSGAVAVDAGRGAVYAARCRHTDDSWQLDAPRRLLVAELDAWHAPVASPDVLAVASLVAIDPVIALARAVPRALARQPLPRAGLVAEYADAK